MGSQAKPIIFAPILAGIERRLTEAAYDAAKAHAEKMIDAIYSQSAGHWTDTPEARVHRNEFRTQAVSAHMSAMLHAAQKDIEKYAIAKIRETAAAWEQYAKEATK